MFNIYSRINKKKLLHVFHRQGSLKNRVNLSPEKAFLQASIITFKEKKIINPHYHLKHKKSETNRSIQESWILFKGLAKIYYYDSNKKFLRSFTMKPGDVSVTFAGGHKLEILKKGSILYEYKTGPYKGSKNDLKYFKNLR
tara:strand:- start:14 stop:436 length:423 start_codon:yes stop_codon:yes gene_type:complete